MGCKIVRLIGYSEEFLPHIEKQLTFGLRESSPSYDATLFLWKESDFDSLPLKVSSKLDIKKNMRLRLEYIMNRKKGFDNISIIDNDFSKIKPIIDIQVQRGFFIGNDYEQNTYYYGVKNLEPEENVPVYD